MKNELFSIGPITIYGYGLMIAIGVLAAYFSATYRSKKYALDPDKVFYVTVWAVIGGFGGAKLLVCSAGRRTQQISVRSEEPRTQL